LKLLRQYESIPILDDSDLSIRSTIDAPSLWLRLFSLIGLTIQAIGHFIYTLGHRIHSAESPFELMIIIAKPALLRFFDIETLKRWKRKLFFQN
jgi:hypothetical protein